MHPFLFATLAALPWLQGFFAPQGVSERGSRERKRRATSSVGATSARPPVLATMHGQPLAIASSATSPNGS